MDRIIITVLKIAKAVLTYEKAFAAGACCGLLSHRRFTAGGCSDSGYQLRLDDGQIIAVVAPHFPSTHAAELPWSKLFSSIISRLMLTALFRRHFQLGLVA